MLLLRYHSLLYANSIFIQMKFAYSPFVSIQELEKGLDGHRIKFCKQMPTKMSIFTKKFQKMKVSNHLAKNIMSVDEFRWR